MSTKFVGMKEFRQNMAKYVRQSRRLGRSYIVTHNKKPMIKIVPLSDEEVYSESFIKSIGEAEADIRAGRTVTQEELMKKYGLL